MLHIITGKPNTGKTTLARMWLSEQEGDTVLLDANSKINEIVDLDQVNAAAVDNIRESELPQWANKFDTSNTNIMLIVTLNKGDETLETEGIDGEIDSIALLKVRDNTIELTVNSKGNEKEQIVTAFDKVNDVVTKTYRTTNNSTGYFDLMFSNYKPASAAEARVIINILSSAETPNETEMTQPYLEHVRTGLLNKITLHGYEDGKDGDLFWEMTEKRREAIKFLVQFM